MLVSGLWYEVFELFKIRICDIIGGIFEHRLLPGGCDIFGPQIPAIQFSCVFLVLKYVTYP
jgi:hypothetical protein